MINRWYKLLIENQNSRENKYQKSLSSLKLLFMSCLCALMLSAVFWVTLSTTPNSQVYADSCIPPTNYPSQPVGGMAYTNWHFDTSQSISSVQFKINIFNNPGNTSDEYLQLYDANIDNTGQYFGLQTTDWLSSRSGIHLI